MISQRERGELARFYTVTDPKKHQKGYTVYKVTARIISRKNPEDVQEITVWKRYSDFRKLHKDLWQIHRNLYRQSELFPPFAKAKVFGRFDDSVIEERRQCSEDLLQFSANIPALYSSQHIEDFFKGGEVHDGSELIGPAEPFSDFLADSLSDCSSEVQKDIGGVDDLTAASQSEYGGLSSDSDLTSLRVDTDSLAELDDGMASGGESPNKSPSPSPLCLRDDGQAQDPEAGRGAAAAAGKGPLFSGSLKPRGGKKDYLERASEQIRLAVQREEQRDYQAAFSFYRSGVDLLLQGVQGEPSPTRREAVKKKTAEYLMRAEQISSQYLKNTVDKGPAQSVQQSLGPQGAGSPWSHSGPSGELKVLRVLGVIDKVLLVLDKRTQETFILKGLRKSIECGRNKKTIVPHCVPNMVRLHKYIVSEDSIFLLLQHAEGGRLWSHVSKFLNRSPEESFDIPFIQKSHTAAVHSVERAAPQGAEGGPSSSSEESGPRESEHDGAALLGLPLKSSLTPSSQDDSSMQDDEGLAPGPLPDSGATSEEECTNSYLTLCNESHPLLSSDSLCSPITAQELRFFTEDETAQPDVFSPAPKPAADSLDQSKRSPMEFFRIDSKDSASEVQLQYTDAPDNTKSKADPLKAFQSPPELDSDCRGNKADLWLTDSDRVSNESVPVISFKDAFGGGRGDGELRRRPAARPAGEAKAKASPKFGKPDVLQLHHSLEEEEEELEAEEAAYALSLGDLGPITDSDHLSTKAIPDVFGALGQDGHGLPFELGATETDACSVLPKDLPPLPPSLTSKASSESGVPSAQPESSREPSLRAGSTEDCAGRPEKDEGKAERDVSQLFRDLDERLLLASQAHIPEEYVQRWAVEIILALSALHQEGIVCRDLNPNNILLNDRGHIQLTYFCSWSEVEDSCDREALAKMYCAPEVGSINEETAACDWWSLGAILFELLTGKSLAQCHPAGISRHTSLNVPDFLSEEAKSLLQQLLQFNPIERLGAGVAGVEDIKSHPFFARVNWPK
ncbi:hypothetical protein AGOR_G00081230 [Albula goreensis]|uniref:Ribosomal protein S6 kinase delta-1 n=1 Tax=Albula goreensis TaxID=1534307 RepID=A0A8T3DPL6_9TELE|nr:hypothetical protein AGOR_G00081230 [Albula goreensis]